MPREDHDLIILWYDYHPKCGVIPPLKAMYPYPFLNALPSS